MACALSYFKNKPFKLNCKQKNPKGCLKIDHVEVYDLES